MCRGFSPFSRVLWLRVALNLRDLATQRFRALRRESVRTCSELIYSRRHLRQRCDEP